MTVLSHRAALGLGAGGLVPFAAFSKWGQQITDHEFWLRKVRTWTGRQDLNATELQISYGCMILSFLGGPHWGFALVHQATRLRQLQLVWGIVPPLIAWPAASLTSPKTSLDVLSAGLLASLAVDTSCAFLRLIPMSYLVIRTPLTLAATASLLSHNYFV